MRDCGTGIILSPRLTRTLPTDVGAIPTHPYFQSKAAPSVGAARCLPGLNLVLLIPITFESPKGNRIQALKNASSGPQDEWLRTAKLTSERQAKDVAAHIAQKLRLQFGNPAAEQGLDQRFVGFGPLSHGLPQVFRDVPLDFHAMPLKLQAASA